MQQVVLATGNPGKVKELAEMLADADIKILPQSQFDVVEAEENGLSFVENAIIKARNASRHTGLPAIADDSGLEVAHLQGAPGIYSARYAGADASDGDNNRKLLQALDGLAETNRKARFRCVIVFLRHATDPAPIIAQGTWEGRILETPQGENGFGYDPLFYVPGESCSAAELNAETKNRLSHRGQALSNLVEQLKQARVGCR